MTTDQASNESWKDVPGYEGFYQVSDHGRVRSLGRYVLGAQGKVQRWAAGRILKQGVAGVGYPIVALCRDGKCTSNNVHSLVMRAFAGPPPVGHEINHIDLDKTNNRLDNLEYVTSQGNSLHAIRSGAFDPSTVKGEASKLSKLTDEAVREIRRDYRPGLGPTLARRYGVSSQVVYCVLDGKTWKHVT
jgi:hypothetical protein